MPEQLRSMVVGADSPYSGNVFADAEQLRKLPENSKVSAEKGKGIMQPCT